MSTNLKSSLAIGITILTFAGAVASGTLWLSKRFSDIEDRTRKLENAVKVLNTEQPDEYKQIIDLLLARESAEPTIRVGPEVDAQRSKGQGQKKAIYWPPGYDPNASPADAPAIQKPVEGK